MTFLQLPILTLVFAGCIGIYTALRYRMANGAQNIYPSYRYIFPIFAFCAAYFSVSAFEYFFFYDTKSLTMWEKVFAFFTSKDLAYGAGSVRDKMHAIYAQNYVALHVHAITGSIMLLLGITQFWTPFRQKSPKIHRLFGKIYVILAIPTCLGALIYLFSATPEGVFSGRPFFVALFGLALGTGFSTYMAYDAAKKRQFEAHQAWMLLSYFAILSAPFLRIAWIILFQFTSNLDHWDNNLYIIAPTSALVVIAPIVIFGMVAKSRSADSNHLTPTSIQTSIARAIVGLNIFVSMILLYSIFEYGGAILDMRSITIISLYIMVASVASIIWLTAYRPSHNIVYNMIITIAILMMCSSLILPLYTSFGPAFPSTFLTFGAILLLSVIMCLQSQKPPQVWRVKIWFELLFAMMLTPLTASLSTILFILLGWPFELGVTSGLLLVILIVPVIIYWRSINAGYRKTSKRLISSAI